MIDTHAHLDLEDFDVDREEVIRRAFDNGIKKIINIGVDLATSRRSIELAEKHENIFASVGFHPEFFDRNAPAPPPLRGTSPRAGEEVFAELKKIATHGKVVAIGECGLDYYRIGESEDNGKIRENQKQGFIAQIEIARESGLPVVAHCREAWDDIHEIIFNFPAGCEARQRRQFSIFKQFSNLEIKKTKKVPDTNFVLHCYSGGKEDTEKFLKLPNVYFSFSGNITYPKPAERVKNFAEVIKMIPLDRIMLDSDSPFLAPQEFRGKRNEPIFVEYIAKKIAEIKNIGLDEVEKKTDDNAMGLFGI